MIIFAHVQAIKNTEQRGRRKLESEGGNENFEIEVCVKERI